MNRRAIAEDDGPFYEETNMDFVEAMHHLVTGGRVSRSGWNGKHQFLAFAYDPKDMGICTKPFIVIKTEEGDIVPWTASQTDITATDWLKVPDSL